MSFEFFVGLRYLLSKKSQAFISLITVIGVIGVAIGVMALIVVLSVQAGFENDLKAKILGNSSHLILLKYGGEKIGNYRDVMTKLRKAVPSITGISPTLYAEVMLTTENGGSSGCMLKGIEPASAASILNLEKNIVSSVEGTGASLTQILQNKPDALPRVVIGIGLSQDSLLFPGDTVSILSPNGEITPFGNQPKLKKFMVAGIFKTGMWEYDSKFVYAALPDIQRFLSLPDVASYIEMRLTDIDSSKIMGHRINNILGPPFMTRDWRDLNGELFDALKLERTVTFITLAMVIIVAAFGIVATLVMMVMEKTKDIAILKAMGASSAKILKIFLFDGLLIGIFGIIFGEIFGITLAILLRDYIKFPLNPTVYFVDTLPVLIDPIACIYIGLFALCVSFIATIYPAWKASSYQPVDGLRYE